MRTWAGVWLLLSAAIVVALAGAACAEQVLYDPLLLTGDQIVLDFALIIFGCLAAGLGLYFGIQGLWFVVGLAVKALRGK